MAKNRILQLVITAFVLAALMALTAFAEVAGGFGVISGVDESYKAAVATLNEAGNGLAIDTENAITLTEANNTGLAGLYAVSNDDFATQTIVYVYGDYAKRSVLVSKWAEGEINPSTNAAIPSGSVNVIKVIGPWNKYAPGYFNGGGYWTVLYAARNEITASGSQQFDSDYKKVWFYNNTWDSALEEAATLAGEDEALLATYKATVDALYSPYFKADAHNEFIDEDTEKTYNDEKAAFYEKVLNKTTNTADLKYAYAPEQIIPINEVNSFAIGSRLQRGVSGYSEAFASKVIAFVYDPEENKVVAHEGWTNTATMVNTFAGTTRTIDFTDAESWTPAFPENGYLVGLRILPWAGMNDATKLRTNVGDKVNPATYNNTFTTGREGIWLKSYSIDAPKAPKPTGLAIAEGKLTGTTTGMSYEYAATTSADLLNGTALTYTAVTDTTSFADAGLYSVRVATAADGSYTASDAVILFVSGTLAEQKEIGNLVITETTARIQTSATNNWIEGYWTGDAGYTIRTGAANFVPNAWPSNYCVTTNGQHVEAGHTDKTDRIKAVDFKYAYDGNEIIPVGMLGSFGYRAFARSVDGSLADANPKSKFIIFVLNPDGTISEHTAMADCSYSNGITDTVLASAFNLPSEGYIIGIQCYPFFEIDEEKSTINYASFELMFAPSSYVLRSEKQATPELAVCTDWEKYYTSLKITNYVSGTTYAYSTDEGETWTEFTTQTLTFTEANKYYWVKALADGTHFESDIAIPSHPSQAAIFKGASLVLDGQIGIKAYFDVDKSVLGWALCRYVVTNGDSSEEIEVRVANMDYEEDGRTASFTVYVAPKDYNDVTVEVTQLYPDSSAIEGDNLKGIKKTIPVLKVSDYFDDFYALVEAGDAACVAANDLVKALDAYCQNADAYFNNEAAALDSVVADTTAIGLIAVPEKSGKFTDGNGNTVLNHYSSALVLEENVTIRHYFKWTPAEGIALADTVVTVDNGKTAALDVNNVKDSVTEDNMQYLYIDIEGIDAANLDTQYTLTLTLGTETISVKYSALNYVKQTYADENAKLANLAKAIYNYSAEAEDYID